MLQAPTRADRLALTVTGAASGTGKTSLVLALGLSFASAGTRTLLIDGDTVGTALSRRTGASGKRKLGRVFRGYEIVNEEETKRAMALSRKTGKPIGQCLLQLGYINETDLEEALSIQKDFGLGLSDALRGERIEDCIADIGIPNLSIMPSSCSTASPVNGMSPSAVKTLLEQLRDDYEMILVDTGPLPGQTESSVLAACTDGVVMVVSRGDSNPNVKQALEHLQLLSAPVAGLVFNRAMPRDIERSGYSSSVSNSRALQLIDAVDTPTDNSGPRMLPARYARFGPLPHAVAWMCAESLALADYPAN
jgi:Mrp family chromosome partitioning ATPase